MTVFAGTPFMCCGCVFVLGALLWLIALRQCFCGGTILMTPQLREHEHDNKYVWESTT